MAGLQHVPFIHKQQIRLGDLSTSDNGSDQNDESGIEVQTNEYEQYDRPDDDGDGVQEEEEDDEGEDGRPGSETRIDKVTKGDSLRAFGDPEPCDPINDENEALLGSASRLGSFMKQGRHGRGQVGQRRRNNRQDQRLSTGQRSNHHLSRWTWRPSFDWEPRWITILNYRIPLLLLVLFSLPLVVLLISFVHRFLKTSSSSPLITPIPPILLSNGTHPWHPLTLIISLDGFRFSYLTTHPTLLPNLLSLASSSLGLRATAMQPVFPTLTFPNHWAMMSGLYPESSGIVANDFWTGVGEDAREFKYTDPEKSWDSSWWLGEPMWSTVHRAGRKVANIMWPGPPVTSMGIAPDYFVPYRPITPSEKLAILEGYLNLDLSSRPSFISLYIPDVDQAGHAGGPESDKVNVALTTVDTFIGDVLKAVEGRNASGLVDLIVVSDHGMASTSNTRLIYLDDIIGKDGIDEIEHKDGWPSVGLRFKKGLNTQPYLDKLLAAAEKSNGTFAVYTHETMPERWHFSRSDRIAGIYVIPDLGWAITDHHEHQVIHEGDYKPKGNHGYDNEYEEMHAIFFAHGPFVSSLKASASSSSKGGWVSTNPHVLERFRNLEIYSLVMKIQGIESIAPPHNGTVGFWDNYFCP